MKNRLQDIGFTYFTPSSFLVSKKVNEWMPVLNQLGASTIIFQAGFDHAIPEDVFISAHRNELLPIVHFTEELPLARKFNEVSFLLDVYAKWGVNEIILGDRPNSKSAWPKAGWHYENLIDHFLDRFIPLANHAVRVGINPVLSPMQPGGDYWDTAFIESVLSGLKRRQMESIIEHLRLSSYGYTFNKPLVWGKGGPERWSVSKPYQTPEGQEDQLGFHNFEWAQAMSQRVTGKKLPILILDAGKVGTVYSEPDLDLTIDTIKKILYTCHAENTKLDDHENERFAFDETVHCCIFAMDAFLEKGEGQFSPQDLKQVLFLEKDPKKSPLLETDPQKVIAHYLLLPAHPSGVSDAVLNKVRPLIKKLNLTLGFSINEALLAKKVSIYPDPILFTDEKIKLIRSSGCLVEILPESGTDIATLIKDL